MTLPAQTRFNNYTGNGVTTIFAYTFRAFSASDVVVQVAGVTKTLGVDYTMSGVDSLSGGNITFTVAPANGVTISVDAVTPLVQSTAYAEGGQFPAATHEKALDRMVAVLQEMNETVGGAVRFPANDTADSLLPSQASRVASYLGFDDSGEFALWRPNVDAGLGLDASQYVAHRIASNAGDILIASNAGRLVPLHKGVDGTVLTLVSGLPAWATAGGGASKWTALVATTDFSTTAASTSTITMATDKTATIKSGMAIKFTLSGTAYYAIVSAITANLMTIAGAPLTTDAGALTALSYGLLPPHKELIQIPGYWSSAADTAMMLNQLALPYVWRGARAYLVQIGAYSRTTDTGASKPRINARLGATTTDYVSTSNTNTGPEVAASATWYRTGIDIATAKYAVSFGDTVELKTDANGTNDDASDLTVELVFVWE